MRRRKNYLAEAFDGPSANRWPQPKQRHHKYPQQSLWADEMPMRETTRRTRSPSIRANVLVRTNDRPELLGKTDLGRKMRSPTWGRWGYQNPTKNRQWVQGEDGFYRKCGRHEVLRLTDTGWEKAFVLYNSYKIRSGVPTYFLGHSRWLFSLIEEKDLPPFYRNPHNRRFLDNTRQFDSRLWTKSKMLHWLLEWAENNPGRLLTDLTTWSPVGTSEARMLRLPRR